MLPWRCYTDLFRNRSILWQNRWGYSCLGLDRLCPLKVVTCVDDSSTYDLIQQRQGIRFFALDSRTGRRTEGRDSALNEILPAFREEIDALLRRDATNPWVIVCPSPCRSLAEFSAQTGHECICPSSELGYWLNDKANFLAALDTIGLPRLPGRWIRMTESRYSEISREMGLPFVAQLARGTSGSGTTFIGSEDEFARTAARYGDAPAWVAPDLGDLSLNINAIAMENGVVVGYPSVQLSGLSMLGCRRGMYCGNDYAATAGLPVEIWTGIAQQTERLGVWLASLGFRGLYGLDFVIDSGSGRAYAVDLNPRWQGSTGLLTQAEYQAGRLPLTVAELAYRMGLLGESEILRHKEAFLQPVAASLMSLRCAEPYWAQVGGNIQPGVYSLSSGISFLHADLYLDDLGEPDEILLNGGVPRQGALVSAGAHVLRAASERAVMDVHRLKPLPWSEAAVRSLYQMLDLTPVASE